MLVSRRGVLLLLLVGGVGVLALFGTGTVQPSDVGLDAVGEQVSGVADSLDTSINESKVEEQVHRRVNAQRLDHDLSLLKFNDRLSDVARSHSEHMASANFFAHESPNGTTHRDRITAGGVTCQTTGENIALDNTVDNSDAAEVAASVVQGWMNSEGHRRNILDGRWVSQGIGVEINGDEVYVTQNFCG